ncbi:MAG: nodulation protein NfeD [Pseudomonadota bacterium]
MRRPPFRVLAVGLCLLAVGALFLALLRPVHARTADVYVHARIEGVINPIEARHVNRAVERARQENARFVLITLDTPGGLVSSMQDIVAALTNAGVPVVVYVEPRAAQATSAGAFILLAADVAAMSPGTRVGAAHPVAAGEALDETLDKKATNSLASLIRSLADRRGRPADLAEGMVRESTSYTAEEAREKKLVEVLAVNEADLLQKLHGRKLHDGRELATRGLVRIDVPLSSIDRFLDRIADPTLTSLFISLGTLAIIYELSTSGIGAGGVIGAVLLVLGLLGSSVLPIETSAVVLFVIGLIAIVLEAKLPTHGILGGAGLVGILLGAALLVDPSEYFGAAQSVRLQVFVPVVVAFALTMALLARITRRALAAPVRTGVEGLIGAAGTARSTFGQSTGSASGQVMVEGARWQAVTDDPEIHPGDPIEVLRVETKPMRLVVRKKQE